MKRVLFIIITLIFGIFNVKAECSSEVMKKHNEELNNLTYELEYAPNYQDMNGDFEEGYFKIKLNNIDVSKYTVLFENRYHSIVYYGESAYLNGDVYNLNVYASECYEPIKTYTIAVPFYKQYCNYVNCEKDKWFDGTYKNKVIDTDNTKKNTIKISLVVTIVVLIGIIVTLIFIKNKKK